LSCVALPVSVDFLFDLLINLIFDIRVVVFVLALDVDFEEPAFVLTHDGGGLVENGLLVHVVNLELDTFVLFLVEVFQVFFSVVHIRWLGPFLFRILVKSEVIEAGILIILVARIYASGAKRRSTA
jgi:hypothetical protein